MKTKQRNVPLCRPNIGAAEIAAVTEVLESGWLAHGSYNMKFEESFAAFLDVPHAISMNSCTSALEIALKASGIGGEVICPSMTWVATANAIVNAGAVQVFCEVDPKTRNVTAETIAEHLSPQTEAVIVVHFGGQPCEMDEIIKLCARHGLLLIEDSAETLGATWKGRQAGSFGIGCFSFFPTKNITTGEGGMLTCRDTDFARKARTLIGHGISSTTLAREKARLPWIRAAELAGHNYRLSNILAAVGYHQLERLGSMNADRVALARRYDSFLKDIDGVSTPLVCKGATHVYQMYTVCLATEVRDSIILKLREAGIGASVHFDPPVHLQPAYLERGCKPGQLPVTEKLCGQIATLPIFSGMTEADQDWVISNLEDALATE